MMKKICAWTKFGCFAVLCQAASISTHACTHMASRSYKANDFRRGDKWLRLGKSVLGKYSWCLEQLEDALRNM